jgi:alpha-ketoglutarate-dependent 2,4-dichlorophenoxyacetate dioxygenase
MRDLTMLDSALRTHKLHPHFGAEVQGVVLNDMSDPETLEVIRDAVFHYGVVLLRGQNLTDEEFYRFAGGLGPVTDLNAYGSMMDASAKVTVLSNIDAQGNILPEDDKLLRMNVGNELWHTDSTFVRPRATISMLYGRVVPPVGGETEFCDTRCAYEALADHDRIGLEGLTAFHSLLHSRSLTGFFDFSEEDRKVFAGVSRPLVEHHAASGRTALVLASHIARIEGMADDGAAAALVGRLMALATRPEYVYSHKWRAGDLLLWDNRCTMHRATPFESTRYVRDMRILRLTDELDR